VRELSRGIRISLALLRGKKIDAARQAPRDSWLGSRNSSRTTPIDIDCPPALNDRAGGAHRGHTHIHSAVSIVSTGAIIAVTANTILSNTAAHPRFKNAIRTSYVF
jgi:hypothetical protein